MCILFQVLQLWFSQLHKRTFCIFFQGQIIFSQSLQAVSFWLCTLRVRRVPRQVSAECPLSVYFSFKAARVSIYFHAFLCWHISFDQQLCQDFVTDSCSGGFSLHCPNNVFACRRFWPFVSPCRHYSWHKTGIASPHPPSTPPSQHYSGIELKLSLLSNTAPHVEVNIPNPLFSWHYSWSGTDAQPVCDLFTPQQCLGNSSSAPSVSLLYIFITV